MNSRAKQNKLGKFLLLMRKKEHITRKQLCNGLCTVRTLDRIESGIGKPDKWTLDALFSRLGKTTAQLEYYIDNNELQLKKLRYLIRKTYEKNEKMKLEYLLTQYEDLIGIQTPLHQQFIYYGKALLHDESNRYEKTRQLILHALCCTIPEFQNRKWNELYFSAEELHLLLGLANTYEADEYNEKAMQIRKHCFDYLLQNRVKEEMRLTFLPLLSIQYAEELWQRRNFILLHKMSSQMIQLLKKNGELYALPEMMHFQARAKQGEKDYFESHISCNNVLLHSFLLSCIIKEYRKLNLPLEKNYIFDPIGITLMARIQSDCHLIGDNIKARRVLLHMTQQELCQGICSIQTLSNIENGKTCPQNQLYLELMERLGVVDLYYEGFVNTSNFSGDDKRFEMEKLMECGKYREAKELYMQLEEEWKTDTNNMQYQMLICTRLDIHLNQLDPTVALKQLEDALAQSLPDYKNQVLTAWCISRNEAALLIQIALLYIEMDKLTEAHYILTELQIYYENSEANIHYQLYQYESILLCLCKCLRKMKQYKEAQKLAEKVIQLSAEWGNGNILPAALYENARNMEKIAEQSGEDSEDELNLCKKTLLQAFCIYKVLNNLRMGEYIAGHYQNKYRCPLVLADLLLFYQRNGDS